MAIKNYYSILGVSPSASTLAIKKAYRKLAHKYHPDKHAGNKLYEQRFKEITEAYKVLSDNRKRNDYNYARFDKNTFNPKYDEPHTVKSLLAKAKRLKDHVAAADPARMNRVALFSDVQRLLTPHHVQLFVKADDEKLNSELANVVMFICKYLPYPHVRAILPQLVVLANSNNDLLVQIRNFDRQSRRQSLWNEYKILVVLMAVLFFCLLIFFISK